MDTVKEQGQRWKATAEIFLKNNIKTYIKDSSGDIYFCEIILVGEDSLLIKCFGPEQRRGKNITLYWPLIVNFEEYKEKEAYKIGR